MKKSLFVALSLLMAAPSVFASDLRIDLDGGARSLGECRGSIEAKASSDRSAVNLVLRGVEQCSNFIIDTTGQVYKLEGENGNRGGSFTVPAGRLQDGWNQLALTVRSNSGKHDDHVSIWILVNNRSTDCSEAAKRAAADQAGVSSYYAQATLDRVSQKGNLVYKVYTPRGSYEVTTSTSCDVLSTQRK